MNIRDLAAEFGVSVRILKRLMPDLFTEDMTGSTHITDPDLTLARNAWNGKLAVKKDPLEGVTMQAWRELCEQLAKGRPNEWEVVIDQYDQTTMVYIMVTHFGELVWSDRGPDLYYRLEGALGYLKEKMQ